MVQLTALFVTLEFTDPIFSGNGVLGRSLVRGLISSGVDTYIVTAKPVAYSQTSNGNGLESPATNMCRDKRDSSVMEECHYHAPEVRDVVLSQDDGFSIPVLEIPVDTRLWRRLDRYGPWKQFADNLKQYTHKDREWLGGDDNNNSDTPYKDGAEKLRDAFGLDRYGAFNMVFAVDWSGFHALESIRLADMLLQKAVYINFRVFATRSLVSTSDYEFYREYEGRAMLKCNVTIVLCDADADSLMDNTNEYVREVGLLNSDGSDASAEIPHNSVGVASTVGDVASVVNEMKALNGKTYAPVLERPHVLLPPLRKETERIAREEHSHGGLLPLPDIVTANLEKMNLSTTSTRFIVSCVRLDRPKNAILFPHLMKQVAEKLLSGQPHTSESDQPHTPHPATNATESPEQQPRVVPLLCGSAADPEYAHEVKEALKDAWPQAIVIEDFLTPLQMAAIFQRTLVNIHPCLYDAFGMTVCEAAAFGVPSMVHFPKLNVPCTGVATSFDLLTKQAGCAVNGTRERQVCWGSDGVVCESCVKAADVFGGSKVGVADLLQVSQHEIIAVDWQGFQNNVLNEEIVETVLGIVDAGLYQGSHHEVYEKYRDAVREAALSWTEGDCGKKLVWLAGQSMDMLQS
ncbi:hypothetical protein SARC_13355 [Sphaeroforma arctica JP610]|uniref:Glycosyl transferase family 1 domain-containing protein n=1 Tax=Sphaeroforma arctica JP610 TaxID=667725 RepID=A0A0L0FBG3_9EUKA|nr:hypothetical protein SARC_13355 [Sphaeroforma arctica JP610]KNC74087.1 hypothetical protein SARC_13355 [Sphaeroforma arctica JP610]|eukprot:XP_014147989.1 hypothetical protein SARC_13355 [Sphaeroforma arctica JP610]